MTSEGDHGDEGGHQAGLQHGPVEDGAVRGAARERPHHCEHFLGLVTYACKSWDDRPDCPSPTSHSTLAHRVYPGLAEIVRQM